MSSRVTSRSRSRSPEKSRIRKKTRQAREHERTREFMASNDDDNSDSSSSEESGDQDIKLTDTERRHVSTSWETQSRPGRARGSREGTRVSEGISDSTSRDHSLSTFFDLNTKEREDVKRMNIWNSRSGSIQPEVKPIRKKWTL